MPRKFKWEPTMSNNSGSDAAAFDPENLPSLKAAITNAYGPIEQIAAYARANPLARLRLLTALHDTAQFTCALAAILIADELLRREEEAALLPPLPDGLA